jgi:putative endonuclease
LTARRQALGATGEATAAAWYEANGYEVVARNWRCRDGEIDLILRQGPTIVFCEVKTRSSAAFGTPAEAVTRSKQLRLRRLAARWLDEHPARGAALRFDVAAILAGDLQVIEGAF